MSRLIEKDEVAAIIGEVIGGDTLAGVQIAKSAGIPSISPTATNPLVTGQKKGRVFSFRACFVDDLQGKVAARFAFDNLKARKAALFIDQAQDYCVGLANYFAQEVKRRGGAIVGTSYIQTGDQDFSAQISALKSNHPDLIYAPNYYAERRPAGQAAPGPGAKNPHPHRDSTPVPELLNIRSKAVNGMYFTAHFHRQGATSELGRGIWRPAKKPIRNNWTPLRPSAANLISLLAAAINQAGGLNSLLSPRPCPGPKTSPASPAAFTVGAPTTTPSRASR